MTNIEKYQREHRGKPLFELYVLRHTTHADTTERHVVLALIEQRKDRRDWWTLLAALVGAATGVLALLWQIAFASR